jgi:hypothetical protein
MPRILLAERDPIRRLIDTAGTDQGPRHRSELLRVGRIAWHGTGFVFSDRQAIGKAIPTATILPCAASGAPVRIPPEPRFCTSGRPAASGGPQDGKRAGRLFEKSLAR